MNLSWVLVFSCCSIPTLSSLQQPPDPFLDMMATNNALALHALSHVVRVRSGHARLLHALLCDRKQKLWMQKEYLHSYLLLNTLFLAVNYYKCVLLITRACLAVEPHPGCMFWQHIDEWGPYGT